MPLLPQGLDLIHVKLVIWFSKNTNPSSPKMRYQIYIQLPKYHILSSQNIRHNKLQMLFKEYLHCLLFRWNQYRLGEGGGHLHNFNWLLRCPSPGSTLLLLHCKLHWSSIALPLHWCVIALCWSAIALLLQCTALQYTTIALLFHYYCTAIVHCHCAVM